MTDEEKPYVTIGRLARVCPTADCNWRSFGDPDAKCPTHGKSISQPDRPYLNPRRKKKP